MKKYVVATVSILVVFAIGLVAFFIWSVQYPDGLEKVMQQQGVNENDPTYHAPLSYGSDYFSALLMGILGFSVVLIVTYSGLKVARRKKTAKKRD